MPLLKPKKKGDETEHYLPINLLSHMSKIYEKLLLSKILRHCEEKAIIPPEQTGFRPYVSCDHHHAKI